MLLGFLTQLPQPNLHPPLVLYLLQACGSRGARSWATRWESSVPPAPPLLCRRSR